jgi:hypothetical protein
MEGTCDQGTFVARSYTLPHGPRVRLRLAQRRDLPAILDLLRARTDHPADLQIARLVQADPRERIAICATALLGVRETIVGFGAIEVGSDRPDTVVVDGSLTGGLGELIIGALVSRSAMIAERRAA